jgi:5-methylthioribose kinase
MSTVLQETYQPLTEENAILLAKERNLFSENSTLSCTEIGDGNLNLVFHIKDQDGNGIIIKQALPYAKVVGESWPLTLKRATIEAEALKLFKKLAPDFVPEVYYTNETLAITIMEDLSHLTIARKGLIDGNEYPLLASHLGTYLAHTTFFTSEFGLDKGKKKELVGKFINPELCKITEDLIFSDPYFDVETNDFEPQLAQAVQKLWNDSDLKLQVALLRKSFLTEAEALLHGDLHTGSVFVSREQTKVIDPEFAYFGPVGFDIGQVIANLLFQAIAYNEKSEMIFAQVKTFWNVYEKEFSLLWENDNLEPFSQIKGFLSHTLQKYYQDAIGYAGCELIRRTIGLSHVIDLDGISHDADRIAAKEKALILGRALILTRSELTTIEQLVTFLQTKKYE